MKVALAEFVLLCLLSMLITNCASFTRNTTPLSPGNTESLIDSSISASMDRSDNAHADYALSSGAPATWTNRSTNITYIVTPLHQYTTYKGNHLCRDYTATAYIHGQIKTIEGISCLHNGIWHTA
ncbi:MAG TPA: hypothetical protein VHA13_05920, partial [Gammaproteobacteria bacterium]|nr:hypothetical protein [Gammaproteobacteria bacterium]